MTKETAMKILKELHDNSLFSNRIALETLIPELAESEDERIKKECISIINAWAEACRVEGDCCEVAPICIAWLEKQDKVDTVSYEVAENEKREFVGYGFLKCKGDFLSFKEGENYWLEYVGKDNYNVRSDNLLGQTFHITPQQLYTVFRPTTWLEKQGQTFTKKDVDDAYLKGISDAKDELEKQGTPAKLSEEEQNSFAKGVLSNCALSFINYLDAHSYEGKMCVSNGECEDIDYAFHNAMWDRLHRYYCKYIEKQDEQKPILDFKASNWYVSKVDGKIHDMTYNPTDKVEPKFKVGDWVVTDKNDRVQIKAVNNDYYTIDNGMYFNIPYIDRYCHLWTIQDARDGDVLHSIGFHNDCIFIFNGLDNDGYREVATGYCCIFVSADKIEFGIQGPDGIEIDAVKPATQIQRDLLFQNMKESGYEWNAKKKELKKIEQKYTVEPIFSIGDVLCDKSCTTLDKNSQPNIEVRDIRNDMYICNNCSFPISQQNEYELVAKRIKPQLAWSEEDEGMKENIEGALDCYESMVTEDWEKEKEWLKSIKDRVSWKPSEKQMETLEYYMHTLLATEHKEVLFGLYNDLKKL